MRKTLLAIALAGAAVLGTATTATAEPIPSFDFADCPAIPPEADPAQWRCEVLISHGTVGIGRLPALPVTRIKTTFAEGRLDGRYASVFGALRAEPIRVPGGLLGIPRPNPALRMEVRLQYAGFSDFQSVGDRMGVQHLKLSVISPLLPATCTIGSDADPIVLRPLRTSGPDVVVPDPRVIRFTMRDNAFAVPRSYGCGPLGRLVERRLGVPAAAGSSAVDLTTYVRMRTP
jgi:hypothetical protein